MASRTPRLSLVALGVLGLLGVPGLSGCSAAVGADEPSSDTGGAIELAVSETCPEASDTRCVLVNGQSVVLPSQFERASVEDAAVAEREEHNAVDVAFSEEGAAVLNALTGKAVRAGDTARLIVKIGGEIQAAVAVMEALDGTHLQLSLSPDDDAHEIVNLIREG